MTATSHVVSRRPTFDHHVRRARRPGRRLTSFLAVLACAIVAVQGTTDARVDAAATGWARFGHFAPVVGEVDVIVDGKPFASGVTFKEVSEYRELPAGRHVVELRASGDRMAASLMSIVAVVEAGGAVTVAVLSTPNGIESQVYQDGIAASAAGRAAVRFIQAAPEARTVDISTADGAVLVEQLSYLRPTNYLDVAPGSYDVLVTDAASGIPVLLVEGWSIEAGVQATVVVVAGSDGVLDVVPLVDAVSVPVPPTGGAETGFGGMADVLAAESDADRNAVPPLAALAVVPVLSAAAGLWATRRRPSAA